MGAAPPRCVVATVRRPHRRRARRWPRRRVAGPVRSDQRNVGAVHRRGRGTATHARVLRRSRHGCRGRSSAPTPFGNTCRSAPSSPRSCRRRRVRRRPRVAAPRPRRRRSSGCVHRLREAGDAAGEPTADGILRSRSAQTIVSCQQCARANGGDESRQDAMSVVAHDSANLPAQRRTRSSRGRVEVRPETCSRSAALTPSSNAGSPPEVGPDLLGGRGP